MDRGRRIARLQLLTLPGLLVFTACGGESDRRGDLDPHECAPRPTSSTLVNVRDKGAKGDGSSDDTAAIQAAVDAVGGTGGTVYVPDGVYRINPTAVASGGNHGIALKSNMTLQLSAGATLRALPSASASYAIVAIPGASHVTIIGGTLEGERSAHTGTGGEWGMGLSILASDHVVVEGVTARECWGDGFYISGGSGACHDVTLCRVSADHNRRQGLSITNVDGLVVRHSTFQNTTGTPPEAGIDIEPNQGETVSNVLITGCTFSNNAGGGFQAGVPVAHTGLAFTTGIVFDGNTVTGNGVNPVGGGYSRAVYITNCDGTQITTNRVQDNTGEGILLTQKATHTLVDHNTVTGTLSIPGFDYWSGGGIYLASCENSTVTHNTVTGNQGFGIVQPSPDATVTLGDNTVSGNGKTP